MKSSLQSQAAAMVARLVDVQKEIIDMEAAIRPLATKLEQLKRERDSGESRSFIWVNDIRRRDVELSSGPDRPFFGHIALFIDWLKKNSTKNWAEWNTVIYRVSDLRAGRMPADMPGRIGDLKD